MAFTFSNENLSKIEDALLAQIDELKLFRPGTSKVSDQSSLI